MAVTRARQLLLVSTHTWGPGLAKPRDPSDYFVTVAARAQEVSEAVEVPESNPLLGEAATTVLAGRRRHGGMDGAPRGGGPRT